ncbi:MAG: hypothetical protein HYY96_01175 [Candidatus Tectomicrobia bacterium]|nr:hypothetical protein [Candidatus Tectomicrobia bacterium]
MAWEAMAQKLGDLHGELREFRAVNDSQHLETLRRLDCHRETLEAMNSRLRQSEWEVALLKGQYTGRMRARAWVATVLGVIISALGLARLFVTFNVFAR